MLLAWMVVLAACAAFAAVPATGSPSAARAAHLVARDAPLIQLSTPGQLLRDDAGRNSMLGPPAAGLPLGGLLLVLAAAGYVRVLANPVRPWHPPDRPVPRSPPVVTALRW